MRVWILLAVLAGLLFVVAYQAGGENASVTGTAGMALLAAAYFLPALVAAMRQHHQATAIGVLNLLLGWTVLGWIGALVWAFTAVRREA